MFWHLGPLDAPVCGLHQSDGNPTRGVSAQPRVGFLPFGCEAASYPFQGSPFLHYKYPINGGDKGRKMLTLLEAGLQVHIFLHPL